MATYGEKRSLLSPERPKGTRDYRMDEDDETIRRVAAVPVCGSYRLGVIICCTLSLIITYAAQSSMSSAMICMLEDSPQNTLPDNITRANDSLSHNSSSSSKDWLFNWDKPQQGFAISSFFVGYYLAQIPATLAAARFGPKRVVVISLVLMSIFQGLAVPAAYYGIGWLYTDRILVGAIDGFLYAPTFALAGHWAPRQETSLLLGIVGMGMELGNVLSYAMSLLACEIVLQDGWPFLFYILSGLGLIISIIFLIVTSDSPFSSSRISKKEARFIASSIHRVQQTPDAAMNRIPVKEILTSPRVWAIVVSQIGSDWLYYFLVTMEPTFLKDVIKLSNLEVNLLTGLPFLGIIPTIYLSGYLCDKLVTKGIISNTKVRKINDFICKIIPSGILIGLGFLPQDSTAAAFTLNLLAAMCMGFSYVSWMANPVDLAPAYTGFIVGICEIGAMWVAIAVPIVFDEITYDKTREEWQLVFYITAGLQAFCFLFYAVFASGELQPWAFSSSKDTYDNLDSAPEKPFPEDYDKPGSSRLSVSGHTEPPQEEVEKLLSSLSMSLGGFRGTSSYEASVKRRREEEETKNSPGEVGSSTVVISGPAVTRSELKSGLLPGFAEKLPSHFYFGAKTESSALLGHDTPHYFIIPRIGITPEKTAPQPVDLEEVEIGAEPYIESDDDTWQNLATRSLPASLSRSVIYGHGDHDIHSSFSHLVPVSLSEEQVSAGAPRNVKNLAMEIAEALSIHSLKEPSAGNVNLKSAAPGVKANDKFGPADDLLDHPDSSGNRGELVKLRNRKGQSSNDRFTKVDSRRFFTFRYPKQRNSASKPPEVSKPNGKPQDPHLNIESTSSIMLSSEDFPDAEGASRKGYKNIHTDMTRKPPLSKKPQNIGGMVKQLFSFRRSKSNPNIRLPDEEPVSLSDEDAANSETGSDKNSEKAKLMNQSKGVSKKGTLIQKSQSSNGNEDEEQVLFSHPINKS